MIYVILFVLHTNIIIHKNNMVRRNGQIWYGTLDSEGLLWLLIDIQLDCVATLEFLCFRIGIVTNLMPFLKDGKAHMQFTMGS